MPALPSWLMDPLFDQFAALLPVREVCDPGRPLRCHRRRISGRIVFDKLVQVARFGCPYEGIADTTCSATTIGNRCDEWVKLGIFAELKRIALDAVDRIVGLVLEESSVDGCITKAPVEARSPARPRSTGAKGGMKRSLMVEGYGIPSDRVLAGAHRHDSALLARPPWTNPMRSFAAPPSGLRRIFLDDHVDQLAGTITFVGRGPVARLSAGSQRKRFALAGYGCDHSSPTTTNRAKQPRRRCVEDRGRSR